MLSMSDYYKILHYLPSSKIDRHYPVTKLEDDKIINGKSKVYPTNYDNYNGIDLIQIVINFHGNNVDLTKMKISFSPLKTGVVSILDLNPVETSIDYNNPSILNFKVDSNATMTDQSKKLTSIESIVISFNEEVTGVEVLDLQFKSKDYVYVLSDLDEAFEDGQSHVLRRLNVLDDDGIGYRKIPDSLYKYVYMAAGAYAWLTKWEYEARPMKEPKSESNNYADRLLGQVETALQRYLQTTQNEFENPYINTKLLNSTPIRRVKHKRHRIYIGGHRYCPRP